MVSLNGRDRNSQIDYSDADADDIGLRITMTVQLFRTNIWASSSLNEQR